AVYCVIGRCDWREDHTDILDKIDDYLWMKLSHVGDPQLLDGNQEHLSLVKLQKMLLEDYEIKEIAEELQLRGDEKKKFIIEEMDKLRKLQAEKEKEEREAKLLKEEREAKLLREEREAKLQAEKELKMEEMRTQLELARIQAQASQQSEHNLTSGSTRSVHEGEHSKFKMPKLPAFVDRKDDLDSWLLRFERFATTTGWPK
ncbi:hypothetical protein EGW08_023784, partial [Elysia chlorotica]